MFCSHCGNRIEENMKFCGRCGTPVEIEQVELQAEHTSLKAETLVEPQIRSDTLSQSEFLEGVPAGYQQHSSGFYYKQEYFQDNMTGKMIEKVTWFNPFTGQYKEVTEDEIDEKRERRNTGKLYILMALCGVVMGILIVYLVPKADPFSAKVSKAQIEEEQQASSNLVNAFREYSKGNAMPME